MLIGVLVYDEVLHRGQFGGLLLLILLLLLLVTAVIQLGHVETEESTSTAGLTIGAGPDALEGPPRRQVWSTHEHRPLDRRNTN